MREKLQTLPLTELKALAKSQGIKGVSVMRKNDLIDLLCRKADELESQGGTVQGQIREPERAAAESNGRPESPTAESDGRQEKPAAESDGRPERPTAESDGRQEKPAAESDGRQEKPAAESDGRQERPTRQRREPQRRGEYSDRQDGGFRRGEAQIRTMRGAVRQAYSGKAAYVPRGDAPSAARNETAARSSSASEPVQQETVKPEETRETAPVSAQSTGALSDQVAQDIAELDSGIEANGILEVMPDGFGFIRCENFLPGENDVYVAPSQIRRFNMKTGDIIVGSRRVRTAAEKFAALLYIKSINGYPPAALEKRPSFEKLTPIFPNERLHMETPGRPNSTAMRVLDLLAPIGKGQRGMIVSPPKAGKTTLLKQVAQAVTTNHPEMYLIILLIDERPEEVTDIKESVAGENVEVIYSTFDELPERHKRVSEMVVERARRLVEHGKDVIILLDSITRLARAYNIVVPPSGRTLSGGMDPAALHMPKRFFGAARNMREGGSLTILATALVNTGSRMDDVVYEEFKGTGNMELVLDRKLSEKRIFPAIDILKSGTRNDHLLLSREEQECVDTIRKATNSLKPEEAVERILDLFSKTRTNREFIEMAKKIRFF